VDVVLGYNIDLLFLRDKYGTYMTYFSFYVIAWKNESSASLKISEMFATFLS